MCGDDDLDFSDDYDEEDEPSTHYNGTFVEELETDGTSDGTQNDLKVNQ